MLLYPRRPEARLGTDGAARSVLYLAIFPMALFLQAVYSESLFLLLSLAAFSLAERGRFAGAGVVAGLAILTRVAGLALLPALAVLTWRHRERLRALGKLALALPLSADTGCAATRPRSARRGPGRRPTRRPRGVPGRRSRRSDRRAR